MDYDLDEAAQAEAGVSIHAGFPNPAADRRLQALDLNQLLITNSSSTFMFRIRGDQGMRHGIFASDIAIVDRGLTPQPQDLIVWHDGRQFQLSQLARLEAGRSIWGVVSVVIHQIPKGLKRRCRP